MPTVVLARTIKGYGIGESGEGKNITHNQKKLNDDEVTDVPHPLRHPDLGRRRRQRAVLPAGRRQRRSEVHASNAARRCTVRCRSAANDAAPIAVEFGDTFEEFHTGTESRKASTTMVFVRMLSKLLRDEQHRQADRADRPGRGAHLRHGGAVPPGGHLRPRRPALRAGRPRHAALLQGSRATGRSWKRASTRPARCRRSSPPAPRTRATAST